MSASCIRTSSWICWLASFRPSLRRRIGPGCSAATSMHLSTNERTARSSPGAISKETGIISSNIPVSMNLSLVFCGIEATTCTMSIAGSMATPGRRRSEGWSWCYRDRIRYRFDHLFASHILCPVQACYLHAFSREPPQRSCAVGSAF